MSTIILFGDESGTMPASKKEGPFVAAFISTQNCEIDKLKIDCHKTRLLNSIKSNNFVPIINFVYPGDDYEEIYKRRMEKFEIMARYSKLMTNNTHLLLTNFGIPDRNYIWIQGMGISIGHSFLKMLSNNEIEKIRIYIDQKSMVKKNREFFEHNISEIPQRIFNVLKKNKSIFPNYVKNIQSNLKFSQEDIEIFWNDNDKFQKYKNGFLVVHHLAKFSKDILKKDGIEKLNEVFENEGFTNSLYDITKFLIAPLDKNAIERWKRSTGLPEPNV